VGNLVGRVKLRRMRGSRDSSRRAWWFWQRVRESLVLVAWRIDECLYLWTIPEMEPGNRLAKLGTSPRQPDETERKDGGATRELKNESTPP